MITPTAPNVFFSAVSLPDFVDTASSIQRSAFIEITPEMAEALLLHNSNNRNLRTSEVRKLVADILQGNFVCSHQGIAFYEDGTLADGQHRLRAIADSGKSVLMSVTLGVDRSAAAYIDMGAKRSETDVFRLADDRLSWANNRTVAMVNVLKIEFPELKLITSADKMEYMVQYEASFKFVMARYTPNTKGLRSAGASTAFVLAHMNGCSEQKLIDAADLLAYGMVRDASDMYANTMFALRNHLISKPYQRSGNAFNHETLYATGMALRKYLDGKVVKRVNIPDVFPFSVYDVGGNIV